VFTVTLAEIENIYLDETPETAAAVLQPLAEAGNAVAQCYMGHLCDERSPRDQERVLEWYRRSSAGGCLEGTHYFASFIYFGFGTTQNTEEALRLFRIAAEAGFDASQWKLGQHFLAIPEHRKEALGWLQHAADQGHELATKLLAETKNARNT
jgi:TPR repeat protein